MVEWPLLHWTVQVSMGIVAAWIATLVVCLIADVSVPFGYVLSFVGSVLTLYIPLVVLLSAGKRVVSFCLACTLVIIAFPFNFSKRFVVVRRAAVLSSLAAIYILVICERYIRWGLSLFVGYHPATGKPYSLVSACDTSFDGFVPLWDENVPTAYELDQAKERVTADDPPPAGAEKHHDPMRSDFTGNSPRGPILQDQHYSRPKRPRENSDLLRKQALNSSLDGVSGTNPGAGQRNTRRFSNAYIHQDIDEDDTPYSVGYAMSCALASKLAYESSEIIKWETQKWGFTSCEVVRWHNCKAFVASNDKAVLIAFAGTHPLNITHYVTDISATLVPVDTLGYVHSGFMRAVGMHVSDHEGSGNDLSMAHPLPSSEASRSLWRRIIYSACTKPVKAFFAVWEKWIYPPFIYCVRKVRKWIGLDDYYQKEKLYYAHNRASTYTQILDILNRLEFIVEKEEKAGDREGVKLWRWKWRRRKLHEKRKLWIAGHSLGGALATLFTAKLAKDFPFVTERYIGGIYTFGQPRMGDINFAAFIERTVGPVFFRFVNDNDLIPRLPLAIPAWLVRLLIKKRDKTSIYRLRNSLLCFIVGVDSDETTNYTHVGTLKFINSDERIVDGASMYRLIYLQLAGLLNSKVIANLKHESWLRISLRFLLPFFINDHLISDYVHALRKNVVETAAADMSTSYSNGVLPSNSDGEDDYGDYSTYDSPVMVHRMKEKEEERGQSSLHKHVPGNVIAPPLPRP